MTTMLSCVSYVKCRVSFNPSTDPTSVLHCSNVRSCELKADILRQQELAVADQTMETPTPINGKTKKNQERGNEWEQYTRRLTWSYPGS